MVASLHTHPLRTVGAKIRCIITFPLQVTREIRETRDAPAPAPEFPATEEQILELAGQVQALRARMRQRYRVDGPENRALIREISIAKYSLLLTGNAFILGGAGLAASGALGLFGSGALLAAGALAAGVGTAVATEFSHVEVHQDTKKRISFTSPINTTDWRDVHNRRHHGIPNALNNFGKNADPNARVGKFYITHARLPDEPKPTYTDQVANAFISVLCMTFTLELHHGAVHQSDKTARPVYNLHFATLRDYYESLRLPFYRIALHGLQEYGPWLGLAAIGLFENSGLFAACATAAVFASKRVASIILGLLIRVSHDGRGSVWKPFPEKHNAEYRLIHQMFATSNLRFTGILSPLNRWMAGLAYQAYHHIDPAASHAALIEGSKELKIIAGIFGRKYGMPKELMYGEQTVPGDTVKIMIGTPLNIAKQSYVVYPDTDTSLKA